MAVGETPEQPFQLSFNNSLRVDFQGAQVTSDSGLILVLELYEAESHLTRRLFGSMLARIAALPLPAG